MPDTQKQYDRLETLAGQMPAILDLFKLEPDRLENFVHTVGPIRADFSKQSISRAALSALMELAKASNLEEWRARFFAGDKINTSEDRAVLHMALRGVGGSKAVQKEVKAMRKRIAAFTKSIHEAGKYKAIVHVGIGGSDLGPRLVADAFAASVNPKLELRFAENVDGASINDALAGLNPKTTLVIVVSKSFTTQETRMNAIAARAWLEDALGKKAGQNFIAVTANREGAEAFGTRAVVKNLYSIRGVGRAISYEIVRQIGVVESCGSVEQPTLGYDAATRKTTPLRSKEEAHDYRYFPEPDLPPVVVDDARRDAIKASIPELPRARRHRFVEEFGLPAYDAAVLSDGRRLADYFEASVTALAGAEAKRIKIAGNLVMTNVLRALSDRGIGLEDLRVTPERLAELADMFFEEKISSKNVKDIFAAMLDAEGSPAEISREMGFEQSSDNDFIEAAIDQVIAENDDAVARYREGKGSLFGFFVGQTMKATNGKANPKIVNALLREKLGDPAS